MKLEFQSHAPCTQLFAFGDERQISSVWNSFTITSRCVLWQHRCTCHLSSRMHTGFRDSFVCWKMLFWNCSAYFSCRLDSMDGIELDSSITVTAAVRICLTLPKFTDAWFGERTVRSTWSIWCISFGYVFASLQWFHAFQAMPNQKFDCKELCGDLCLQFDRFGRSTWTERESEWAVVFENSFEPNLSETNFKQFLNKFVHENISRDVERF